MAELIINWEADCIGSLEQKAETKSRGPEAMDVDDTKASEDQSEQKATKRRRTSRGQQKKRQDKKSEEQSAEEPVVPAASTPSHLYWRPAGPCREIVLTFLVRLALGTCLVGLDVCLKP